MKITAIISPVAGLRRQPIQFICPNCKQYVAGLATEAQMMVHFTETACHFCDHLLTPDDMVNQVQTYVMQHFDQVFKPDK
jgi:thioredoxin-related protein